MNLWKTSRKAFFGLLALSASFVTTAQVGVLDRIAAIVDDDIVLKSELDQRLASIYRQIQQSGTQAPPEEILQQQVLERLISERLQLSQGYRAGVRISDEEINQTMQNIAASQNLSLDQYVQQLHSQELTLSTIRAEIRDELIIRRVQQAQVNRRIRISDQELDNFLNSEEGKLLTSPDVRIGHILLPVSSGASKEETQTVLEKASDLYQQSNSGVDFRQLAITHSTGQKALEGGDLGWRKMAQLPSVFIDAVEGLELGEVSQPIRSGAGFHLLKLYERRGGGEQLIEQHLPRHILLKPNEIRDDTTTLELLNSLRQRALDGEDFALLAKEFSEDPGSALRGGELGWSTPGLFVPAFEQTMNTIPVGDISKPFRSPFGWHILQVTDRRKQDFSQDILRNRAQNVLRQRKYEEELQVWLQEIRDKAFVEIKEFNNS